MPKIRPIRRALVSVSKKAGVVEFCQQLHALNIEILSTGGTAKLLLEADIPVKQVSEHIQFPEILGGRVKTLHPRIHGGILARRGEDDEVLEEHDISPIDMVVVNLYPFEETINRPDVSDSMAIENIDIGGPCMLRAAAKNHTDVTVLVDHADYPAVIEQLQTQKGTDFELRRELARKAFSHTARYDSMIAQYLNADQNLAEDLCLPLKKQQDLRYGENPHQKAAFYRDPVQKPGQLAGAIIRQGKPLSFNNLADSDAAWDSVKSFAEPACVIVKHANPCGVAIADKSLEAYNKAYATDPTSAFGGIIAFNRPIDGSCAQEIISRQFVEVVIAPDITAEALDIFAQKPNVRVLSCALQDPDSGTEALETTMDYKRIDGGFLVQEKDTHQVSLDDLKIVTETRSDESELADLLFAWKVAKQVKSNAIVYAKDGQTIGIGAGQMSRVYSAKIAAIKAADEGLEVAGSVMASDAFFPFRDTVDEAAKIGIRAIIQPGGSIRDEEVIAAANEHGIAMVFTGIRHFKH